MGHQTAFHRKRRWRSSHSKSAYLFVSTIEKCSNFHSLLLWIVQCVQMKTNDDRDHDICSSLKRQWILSWIRRLARHCSHTRWVRLVVHVRHVPKPIYARIAVPARRENSRPRRSIVVLRHSLVPIICSPEIHLSLVSAALNYSDTRSDIVIWSPKEYQSEEPKWQLQHFLARTLRLIYS